MYLYINYSVFAILNVYIRYVVPGAARPGAIYHTHKIYNPTNNAV